MRKNLNELKAKLSELANVMQEIEKIWTDSPYEVTEVLEQAYPFDLSFDEQTTEVCEWVEKFCSDADAEIKYRNLCLADMIESREKIEVNSDNVDTIADRGVEYEDLHSSKYDAQNVFFYHKYLYIIETQKIQSKEVFYHLIVDRSDYMFKTLREAEIKFMDEFVFDEHYNNVEARERIEEQESLKEFLSKA